MTRSQRLDPLLRVVQQRQDAAARDVAERDRALAEQEARLDALRQSPGKFIINGVMDENAIGADAGLAGVAELADHSAVRRLVEIG